MSRWPLTALGLLIGVAVLAEIATGSALLETKHSHVSNRVDAASHWAFRPLQQPTVPPAGSGWVRNPIDAFVTVRHAQEGLVALEAAPPHILIRRLYLDLVGVPPTAAELEEFTSQPTDDRYAQIVNRLLDSPRYGERWGRHWMDIWR